MTKLVTVLGATGSVGQNTLDIIRQQPSRFCVDAVSAYGHVAQLAADAKAFGARAAVIADPDKYTQLQTALEGSGVLAMAGAAALEEIAAGPADVVVGAIMGFAGLPSILAAVRAGKTVAVANKESLVCAGEVVMAEARTHGATLLPVDSEHSAIFQVYDAAQRAQVRSVTLTASGGPFRTFSRQEMAHVTPAQAVAHPNWSMGAKISVDSATLMNKGLEVIEAAHLFPVHMSHIQVVVHPQSIIHGMVEYSDGSVLAQLGAPDMRTPLSVALGWPERLDVTVDRLRLTDIQTLTFEEPDLDRFPCLQLARASFERGSGACTVLNSANEVAVQAFLAGQIKFLDIERIVTDCLTQIPAAHISTLDEVAAYDCQARQAAQCMIHGLMKE